MGCCCALVMVFLNIRLAPPPAEHQISGPRWTTRPLRPSSIYFLTNSRSTASGGKRTPQMLNNGKHENGHHETLRHWETAARWEGITRLYTPEDVARLSG